MHVSLFTPDRSWDQHAALWGDRVGIYARLLAPVGIQVEPVRWTEAAGDRPALALLAWGYHLLPDRWQAVVAGWNGAAPLMNPPAVLLWNSDKRYLQDLAAAGVPTVPTRFVAVADEAAMASARAAFGVDELVVKPRISAAAHDTARFGPADAAPMLADAMIQPFLPSVQTEGELSVFFFNGRRAHAVRKVAAPGDFRVQREYGGAYRPVEPDGRELEVAEAALACAPALPLYARIDMVPGLDGKPQLMEVEMVEPDLYLDLAPDGGAAFAQAAAERLFEP